MRFGNLYEVRLLQIFDPVVTGFARCALLNVEVYRAVLGWLADVLPLYKTRGGVRGQGGGVLHLIFRSTAGPSDEDTAVQSFVFHDGRAAL